MQKLEYTDFHVNEEVKDVIDTIISEAVDISSKIPAFQQNIPIHPLKINVETLSSAIAKANSDGLVLISPTRFVYYGDVFSNFIVKTISEAHPLAISVLKSLEVIETFGKIISGRSESGKVRYGNTYLRLICSLCLSSTGKSTIEDFTEHEIIDWFNFFGNDDTGSFRRKDFWGTSYNIAGRCLKEIAKALARIFHSGEILKFSKAVRPSAVKGSFNTERWDNLDLMDFPGHLGDWVELYHRWRKVEPPALNSPEFRRRPRVRFSAAFRTLRATASRS